ncbi:germination protein YpeB [Desulfovirgula thermocuniculi]|uniref:germination protein YpeB n=1 Tax=Desulfovirgula thermocuniculi TaxID=348842 RepID=UPI00041CBABC|nr:germination protein YpeB [Desulfovirgula thermocuniculi]
MDRKRWLLPLALGVILVGALCFWGYQQSLARQRLTTVLNNKYYRSFYDLLENVQNLEVLLSKSLVAGGQGTKSRLLMDLWQRANAAQASLNQLPVGDALTGRTAKFLTQVGDYAYALLLQISQGKEVTESQWQTLQALYQQARDLNGDLAELEARLAGGKLVLSELAREGGRLLGRKGPQLASGDFQAIEKRMSRFPTLIYDGPFSDHLEKREPRGLSGGSISAEEAGRRAREFVRGGDYEVARVGEVGGKIPSYLVELKPKVGRAHGVTVAVTKQGGHLNWLTAARAVGAPALSIEQARQKARDYLASLGYRDLVPVYFERQNATVVVNFAATQEGVILYPDQIKVAVGLDNGEILGIEASGYLMNHRPRHLPRPQLSATEARQRLNPRLQEVRGGRLVLIPLGIDKEKLAYEFAGRLDRDLFLVYINAADGREEQILRVVHNPEGVLTL